MLRGVLIVEVTTPPEAVSMFEPGAEKLGEFVRLKASARNCTWLCSLIRNCLNNERSRFLKRPSRRMSAPELPQVKAAGRANALLSNHWEMVGFESSPEP